LAKKQTEDKAKKTEEAPAPPEDIAADADAGADAAEEQAEPEEAPPDKAALAAVALEEEKEEYKNALIRERADFENYKKRNADLAAGSYRNGAADTVSAILPVLDNFERALGSECADKAFSDGMEMIMRQLTDVLRALGVEEIDTSGQFDPMLHNAVMQAEEEGRKANDIVETMQKGYKLKDKILRHAMVKVNK
jgi:molecular chaperone GrpE